MYCHLDPQLKALWNKKDTEVVISVVPSQIRGRSCLVHHSEFWTLRPHEWLTGEVCWWNGRGMIVTFIKIVINSAVFCLNFNMILDHWVSHALHRHQASFGEKNIYHEPLHSRCDPHWGQKRSEKTQFVKGTFAFVHLPNKNRIR